jgi:large subunit ribosomal protein L18
MTMTQVARERRESRVRRHERIRKKMDGTPDCPRLCVFRSHKHIYGQIVDDTVGRTLLTVGSLSEEVAGRMSSIADAKGKTGRARAVGIVLAEKAREQGLTRVRFDRGGYIYHGRIKALADGAREGGLEF